MQNKANLNFTAGIAESDQAIFKNLCLRDFVAKNYPKPFKDAQKFTKIHKKLQKPCKK